MSSFPLLIADYGSGNIFNVQSAFESLGVKTKVSGNPEDIQSADRIVIPGVGSFADGMAGLETRDLVNPILEAAKQGKPILGICLGMQLMLSESEEWGIHRGLDLVKGRVVALKTPKVGDSFKIPHIGWNKLRASGDSRVLKGLSLDSANEFFMYFLHSFYADLQDRSLVRAETSYGANTFCSFFEKENLFGFQPHPERSGVNGLAIFKNFLEA